MGIAHHNETIEEDEELCPSLENVIVLTWLRLLHPGPPKLFKQRYGMELRSRTLASIKPEISQALESLLEELQTSEDAKSTSILTNRFQKPQPKSTGTYMQNSSRPKVKSCPLCKTANRPDRHYLSKRPFLPSQDRNFMAKACAISDIFEQEEHTIYKATSSDEDHQPIAANRIQVRQSPYIDVYLGHHPVRLTVDSGATGNMICASTATYLNAEITLSSQFAHQADGSSPLKVTGETRLTFVRDNHIAILRRTSCRKPWKWSASRHTVHGKQWHSYPPLPMSGIYWKRFRIQYKFSDTETRDMLYAEHTLFALLQSPQLFGPVNSWRSNCHQRWHTLILHLLWNRTHVAVNRGPIYGLLCLFFKALQGNYAYQISLMLHDTSNAMNTSAKSEKHIYKNKLRRQALIHQSN